MNIMQIRLSKNMTQRQLADAIGVEHSVISKYEKGQILPPANKLQSIAKILGVKIDLLYSDSSKGIPIPLRRRASPAYIPQEEKMIPVSVLEKYIIAASNGICQLCSRTAQSNEKDDASYLESYCVEWIFPMRL